MIKFKNINGDVFLAVGSIKRKSALNGEKSLTGTLFEGDDVLNKIDKGWSLEFDDEPYVVTYFERNDNDNTVEFDAIHKFFWDMNKDVLYFSWSGSHTAKAYLEQIFKDTGYQYALNFEPSAFEKENWGMKNKLSLFNDVIDSMGGEFEINGTLVSIFKNVGSDLSTIVRHGFNLSDMSLENDNTDFVTYGEGFGAYEDQENQTGERLHVTYTSPLAKTFGKLHAEPIDDQRYTIKDNLLQAIKDKVDGSFAISIKLSLYDLTAAGYPYKMANVGDWLLAIDENLDFKQKIRIISVDDEFATDGTRISYTVTCGDIGVVQKYQQANASLGQKVDSAYQNAQDAKESSIQAVIAANGKNTNYYVNGIDNLPATANEGDIAFVQTGDGQAMYIWIKMPDGSFKWVKRLDPDTGEQIATGVDEAIETAKSQAAQMDAVRASEAAVFQSEANAALSSAAAERATFSSNATSMANSAASRASSLANSAAAYGKAQATSALSSANMALSEAETRINTTAGSAAKSMVDAATATAHSEAQQVAQTASQALSNAKADLGDDIKQNHVDIVAAQTELSSKVSQSDYDKKTNELDTKYAQVKETADGVTADVASYKLSNDKKVNANTAQLKIVSDEVSSKVSSVDFDETTGEIQTSIDTVSQKADALEISISSLTDAVNSQGQVNQLFNTEFTPDLEGWSASNSDITYAGISKSVTVKGSNVLNITHSANTNWSSYRQQISNFVVGGVLSASVYARATAGNWNFAIDSYDANGTRTIIKQVPITTTNMLLKIENVIIPSDASKLYFSFWGQTEGTIVIYKPMLAFDKTVGSYIQGAYNNNEKVTANTLAIKATSEELATKVAKSDYDRNNQTLNSSISTVSQKADGVRTDVEAYMSTNDGKVSTNTANINALSKEIELKVSQSDYDKKTQDLDTKYGQVKVTADAVTNEVAKYKIDNDKKVSANTAGIGILNGEVDSKVSQTTFDEKTGDLDGKYTATKQTVDSMSGIVTELQTKANAQGQVNQLLNTEFTPDLQGWSASNGNISYAGINRSAVIKGSNVLNITHNATTDWGAYRQQVSNFVKGGVVSASLYARATVTGWLFTIDSFNANGDRTIIKQVAIPNTDTLLKIENITIPSDANKLYFSIWGQAEGTAVVAKPMLVFNSTVGDYVQGNYNNNARVTAIELDVSGIHGAVNDPAKGLSAVWNLANNGQTVAVSASSMATVAQSAASNATSSATKASSAASAAQSVATVAETKSTTAITTANGVQTTVKTTRDDVDVLQGQQTIMADQIATEIDNRETGDSNVFQQSQNFTISKINDVTDGYKSEIDQSAKGIIASVSTPNQLINTEFTPDLQGWSASNSFITSASLNKSATVHGSNVLNVVHGSDTGYGRYSQKISSFVTGGTLSASVYARQTAGNWVFTIDSYDSSGTRTIVKTVNVPTTNTLLKFENVTIPNDAAELYFSFWGQMAGTLVISQPMLVFSNTVSTYMVGSATNSSTVLSLLKDNWSIGVADNIGKITNGIIGDTSSMALISNNVIIKSPSTQITGNTWITRAMIKDGAIGNAQIGHAAISNAQIIDVDVSKISGNVANFITGNINTLNSSVLYGNTGHLTTVDTGLIINNQDDHLQLSAHGQYDVPTKRAQFELLGYADNIDSNMQGSLNYYKNPHNAGTGLGIRFFGNQILAIDEAVSTGNLYLSPYASGQVQVVNRDRNGFQDIKASNFVSSSERKYKSDIKSFDEDALAIVNNTKIRQYIKNDKSEIGVIADEAPEQLLTEDGKGITLYDMVSVVYKAVQELDKKVESNNG